MTRGRHSLASRNARAQKLTLIAAPLVTCAAVGAGIALSDGGSREVDFARLASHANAAIAVDRTAAVSRSTARAVVVPVVTRKLWTTTELDLRLTPEDNASTSGEVAGLRRVGITGVRRNGFAQVLVGKQTYWVTADYLARSKPTDPAHLPLVDKPCAGTSSVENGITASAVRVYRAVCNNFPQITHFGGYDAHGEHSSGRALDIMTRDVTLGTAIADFLRAHASELNLFDVIWHQHIWTPVRAGEGWRAMPNRGSATANHMDHVHVSVN
ncbi:MAG: hypothetical protein ACJ716_17725 [Marmoricola sp.]